MKHLCKRQGFTLIEIIVVLIILGVLVGLVIPSLYINIEKSKAAEAIVTIGTIKTQLVGCLQNPLIDNWQSCYGQGAVCGPITCVNTVNASNNYYYNLQNLYCTCSGAGCCPGGGPQSWRIEARKVATDEPVLVMSGNVGVPTVCWGVGKYAGIC